MTIKICCPEHALNATYPTLSILSNTSHHLHTLPTPVTKAQRYNNIAKSSSAGSSHEQTWTTRQARSLPHSQSPPNHKTRRYFRALTTLVIACRIVIPARSISFRDRPVVTHTFSAGWGSQSASLALLARGMLLRRVMRMPFVRHYIPQTESACPNYVER